MPEVRLRLFASYREKTGIARLTLDLPLGSTVGDLVRLVGNRFPKLSPEPDDLVVAVNYEYRDHSHKLSDDDEVALIPPVSGGSTDTVSDIPLIMISKEPIDPELITNRVRRDTSGAVVTFVGTTRSITYDREVLYLEYEAYLPMAQKKLQEVWDELHRRWEVDAAIAHRIGRLEIGEPSLVVAISSRHRKEAFDACQHSVDLIKTTVPIWKKEFFVGGEVWVESPEDVATREQQNSSAK